MANNLVHLHVTIMADNGCALKTNKTLNTKKIKWTGIRSSATFGIIYTAYIAQWACPIVAGTTFMQIPHSGMRGCTILTSYTLAACAFAFAGYAAFKYDSNAHTAESTGVTLKFWPRHISIKAHNREYADIVPITDGIVVTNDTDTLVYMDSLSRRYHVVDELIVQTCRTVVLAQTKVIDKQRIAFY
jgi:hypothetical protein